MNSRIRVSFLCLAFVFSIESLFAQTGQGQRGGMDLQQRVTEKTGVIVCMVLDENNQPLEYTTVAVLRTSDSSIISGGLTNEKGACIVDNIPWGTYLIKISYVGYKSVYISNVSISKEKPVFTAPKQKINTSAKELNTVTIGAQKEMIQANLDKRVFNVDKSIVTEGTTGLNILENIPSVQVDLDGNIKLRGSSSVTILVDGRPTNLSMDEIPASMISSVEVVTNPSARYEPDGVSGIINIVLKKEDKMGFNATVTLGTGMSDDKKNVYFGKGNASVNLNIRYKKVNFFVNYNFRAFNSNSFSDLERKNLFQSETDTMFLTQTTKRYWGGMPQNVRTGFDFFIDDRNTISIEGGYRFHKGDGENNSNSLTKNILNDTVLLYNQKNYFPPIGTNNWNASVRYYNESKVKGRNLSADLSFSTGNRSNETDMFQEYFSPSVRNFNQFTYNTALSYRVTGQVDFVTPLGAGGRLEAGLKSNWRSQEDDYTYETGTDIDSMVYNLDKANSSTYTEIINAAYLVYANSLFNNKFKYQLGLRAELANVSSVLREKGEETPATPKPLFGPFPTVHLRYEFNDIHSLQLSYSRRIGRPNPRQLNPYLNDSDPLNLSQGNIYLKPEYTNSFDLGYLFIYKKTSVSANLFYKYKYDIITRYTELINDSTTLTTFQNIDNCHSYGVEASYQQDLFKFWKLSLNGSLFQTIINSKNLIDPSLSNDFSWQLRLNNTFSLPKDFQIQLSANYFSPSLTAGSMGGGGGGMFFFSGAGQGKMDAIWNVDLGVRKSFFKKSLTLALRVSDIFNSRQTHVISFGETDDPYTYYSAEMWNKRDSRQIWLTVTYNISNYKITPKKQRQQNNTNDDDDMDGGMMF